MKINIPSNVEWILNTLRAHGYEAFAVGGCVRDTMLGRTPGDWDITTSARPEQVKAVFRHTVDTGLQHGTVTVLKDHTGYEVTTYRIDGEYEDGRHPKSVEFTAELREDLRRRDFTINAMAYSHETGVVDLFGGMEDLEQGVIRCVGNPVDRFTEDALRILRAIRFSAQLGFEIEQGTRDALALIAPNLKNVSKERIMTELTKLLLSSHPERMRLVFETGMFPYIAEHFDEAVTDWEQEEEFLRAAGELLPETKAVRWVAFLKELAPKEAAGIMTALKSDNDTRDRVRTLTDWFDRPISPEPAGVRRAMSAMTDEEFDDLLRLREVAWTVRHSRSGDPRVLAALRDEIRARGDCIRLKDLAVTGRDLIEAGIRPGKQLGQILGDLFACVLEEPEKNRKETLLDMVDIKLK